MIVNVLSVLYLVLSVRGCVLILMYVLIQSALNFSVVVVSNIVKR